MEDVIHFAEVEGARYIVFAKLEARLIPQMGDVLHPARQQIIGANYRMTLRQQGVT